MRDASVGDTIDRRYVLKREIARGGMGAVFEAVHAFTGRQVAVKVAHSESGHAEECRERLLREARALTTVRHPNVVEVLDAGVSLEGEPYVVLEMLEGRTLDGILASRQRLSVADVVHVGRQICEALAFAHARGVVHRDLKPGNIFISRNELGVETVKLFDFGIAVVPLNDVGARRLTKQGELLGTPEYMAPEQLLARENVDQRCDIYAAGVTLFECLAGDVPYNGSYPEILMQVMGAATAPSVRAARPDVPARVAAVLEAAMQKEMDARLGDALRFANELVEATGLPYGSSTLLGSFHARKGVRADADARPSMPSPLPAGLIGAVGSHVSPVIVEHAPPVPASGARTSVSPALSQAGSEGIPRQRRRATRAPYVTPARVVQTDGTTLDGRTEDISEGGLLVVTDRPCTEGEHVNVRFALPTTGTMVTLTAKAQWVRTARGRNAVGVEFVEVPAEIRGAIASYVALTVPADD